MFNLSTHIGLIMTAMLVSCSDGGANDTILANDIKTINVVDETATELTLDLGEDISVNTSVTVTPTITGNVTSYTWSAVSGPGNVSFSDTSTELPTISFDADGSYTISLIIANTMYYAEDEIVINYKSSISSATI